MSPRPDARAAHRDLSAAWSLDPAVVFLNHGSYGACPRAVLAHQRRLQDEMEREPVDFLGRRLGERLDAARAALARFLGADPEALAPVTNATAGVNAVLRSLPFSRDDELLVTDHAYNACRNALDFVARRAGASVRVVSLPFPLEAPEEVVERVVGAVTPRTRIALVDHVTSPTGLVLPLEELVRGLEQRGVDALVDGAHAPGMVPLGLDALGAAYYAGNCHKWLCAPKGAGFLYVRADRRERVRPLVISHGANRRRPGRSAYHDEFDWTGTRDPTAFLSVPVAIEHLASLVPGGWPEIRRRNRALTLEARALLGEALGVGAPCPEEMIGSLASLPLPDDADAEAAPELGGIRLQERLRSAHGIEVPVPVWPAPPRRLMRISAQLYNRRDDYVRLAEALTELLQGSAG
jgi:isopenicillin-N epimerase